MSEAIQNITSKLEKVYDFDKTTAVVKAIIESLVAENPSINVDCVNKALEYEENRRGEAAIENKKVIRAMSPIYEYIEKLINAAITDMIHEHGCFQIPSGHYNEDDEEEYNDIDDGGFFSKKIQNKYELACIDSWKDDTSDQGQFSIKPVGKLKELFASHNLHVDWIEVEFNGDPGADSVDIVSADGIYDSMGEISMSWDESVKSDDLIKLNKALQENPNKNLLIHTIKFSKG